MNTRYVKRADGSFIPLTDVLFGGGGFIVNGGIKPTLYVKLPDGTYARFTGDATLQNEINEVKTNLVALAERVPLVSGIEPNPPRGLWFDTGEDS